MKKHESQILNFAKIVVSFILQTLQKIHFYFDIKMCKASDGVGINFRLRVWKLNFF